MHCRGGAFGNMHQQRSREERDKVSSVSYLGPALGEASWEEVSAVKREMKTPAWWHPVPGQDLFHEQWVENYFGSFSEGPGRLWPVHRGERFLQTLGVRSVLYLEAE